MYQQYKIVVNTAAGRRRYMQYLIPYIVSCKLVDRYDIWVNTHNGADIEFFKQVAAEFPVVNLVRQPDGVVNGNQSINAFYRACVAPDTIYFKLDDDIVWMEPDLIEKMVKFRVEHPQFFLVTPLVINNALSTYLLQVEKKLKLNNYHNASAGHPLLWKNGVFAAELHTWFIDNYLKTNRWEELYVGKKIMGMTRFSINAVLWFGEAMRKFSGVVPGDDEEFLSCIYPTKEGLSNAWNGDAIVSHFAFFPQRAHLDKVEILRLYGQVMECESVHQITLRRAYQRVQEIISDVQRKASGLERCVSPYTRRTYCCVWKEQVKKFVPQPLLLYIHMLRHPKKKSGFILK